MFKLLLFLLFSVNSYSSALYSPDSDTAILLELLSTSHQALKATADLIETESKVLDRIEEVQDVIEEKENKLIEVSYLYDSSKKLSESLNGIENVETYTDAIGDASDLKDSSRSYVRSVKVSKRASESSANVVKNTVSSSVKSKKFKDKVNYKDYSGRNASTKAAIDSARNTSTTVDLINLNNQLLSQLYAQNKIQNKLLFEKEKQMEGQRIRDLMYLGIYQAETKESSSNLRGSK